MTRLVVLGDVLLDRDVTGEVRRVMPDAPAVVLDEQAAAARPGGAGLAALLAASDGHDVALLTWLADDAAAREARALLEAAGVEVLALPTSAATPEKIRLRSGAASLIRWDRGGEGPPPATWDPAAARLLGTADAVLVSCYGRGAGAVRPARAALESLDGPVVWDPHPRGPAPVRGVAVATPNAEEARRAAGDLGDALDGDGLEAITRRARHLAERWGSRGVAVTLGARGALLAMGDGLPLVVPAPAVPPGAADTCGAGDRFASALALALGDGALPSEALGRAVAAASSFVAAGGAGALGGGAATAQPDAVVVLEPGGPGGAPAAERDGVLDAIALAERVRAAGGTVVATGGCFDLVHTGHAQLLEAARRLGDCLIVCVNGDASVRRLKGPERPIVGQRDRAALLRHFGCVDAVAVFDEDTPVELLRRLRPHVFAKGGDYSAVRIPEADALAEWGGQAVTLPYLDGRSTTRLLQEVQIRAR
jgi:D-beta-D-heptose 7-phosphate kinase / D-beta-D-heptose 1-phosphate adenosyltransferase